MEEIKRSVVVIGQLLGAVLGEDFSVPTSQTPYESTDSRCIV